MKVFVPKSEEVFANPNQSSNFEILPRFLFHFALQGEIGVFTHFNTSAGKRPEIIAFTFVKQNLAFMDDDGTRSEIESIITFIKDNH